MKQFFLSQRGLYGEITDLTEGSIVQLNQRVPLGVRPMAGTASLDLSGASVIKGNGALAGAGELSFINSTASIKGTGALAGAAGLAFGASGDLHGIAPIAGSAALSLGASGPIEGLAIGQAPAVTSFSATAVITGLGELSGVASAGTFGASAVISAPGTLAGSASLSLEGTGTLGGIIPMDGVASLSLDAQALFTTLNPMFGTASMVFQESVTPLLGALSSKTGTATLSFGASAVLSTMGNGSIGKRLRAFRGLRYDPEWIEGLNPQMRDSGLRTGVADISFGATATLLGTGAIAGSAALSLLAGPTILQGIRLGAGSADLAFAASATYDPASLGNLRGTASLSFSASAFIPAPTAMSGVASMSFGATLGDVFYGVGRRLRSGYQVLYPSTSLYYLDPQNNFPTQLVASVTPLSLGATAVIRGIGNMQGTASLSFGAAAGLSGAMAGTADVSFGATAVLTGLGVMTGTADLTLAADGSVGNSVPMEGAAILSFGATAKIRRKNHWFPEPPHGGGWTKKAPLSSGWTKETPLGEDWIKETGT